MNQMALPGMWAAISLLVKSVSRTKRLRKAEGALPASVSCDTQLLPWRLLGLRPSRLGPRAHRRHFCPSPGL